MSTIDLRDLDVLRPPDAQRFGITSATFQRWPGRQRGEWYVELTWASMSAEHPPTRARAYGPSADVALAAAVRRAREEAV